MKRSFTFYFLLTLFFSLFIGLCISILLKAIHHNNRIASSSQPSLSGMLLFCAQLLLRPLLKKQSQPDAEQADSITYHIPPPEEAQKTNKTTKIFIFLFCIAGILTGAFFYYYYSNRESLLFSILDTLICLALLYSVYIVIRSLFVLVITHRQIR